MSNVRFRQRQDNKNVELISHKNLDDILAQNNPERYWPYREKWHAGIALESFPNFPLSLDVENLNHCNFACHHCMFSSRSTHPDLRNRVGKQVMDFELYKKAVDECAGHGLPSITHGVLCEPLLHPDIIGMVKYAQDKGVFDQRLGTNGSRLSKEVSEAFV